jgi:hypothetical protein
MICDAGPGREAPGLPVPTSNAAIARLTVLGS